jgi:exodeoxyribonuclease X
MLQAMFWYWKEFSTVSTASSRDPKLKDPVQEMIKISNNPVLMARMPYGKHKGRLFRDVPKDYLEWLQTTELDEDMAYTVKEYLGRLPG